MRVPSLAALAVICAACADGTPTAITSPDTSTPSFWLVTGDEFNRIARCEFVQSGLALQAGDDQQVGIRCSDSRGRDLGQINAHYASYTSDNPAVASVDTGGRITARASGQTYVRATHPQYPMRDSIPVTVTGGSPAPAPAPATGSPAPAPAPAPAPTPSPTPAPTPPPPTGPPAPTAGFPNQPSGMILITDRDFDSKARTNDDRGSSGSDGWDGIEYRYGNFSIANDPSAPNGDGRVGQMFYSANFQAGTGPAVSQLYMPPNVTQLYVSIWARISHNWVGNQSGTNKMFFVGVAQGNNQFFLSAEGSGSNTLEPQIRLQGVLDPRPRIKPNRSWTQIQRGAWQRWEFVLKCNSRPGAADGAIDMWINGQHITSVSGVVFTQSKYPTRPCNMHVFNWNPTYGGGGASPGVNQYLWFDRVYISGK